MMARCDCYAHIGVYRGVHARDLLAAMNQAQIQRAVLVPFLDAPGFDDLLEAAQADPKRFRALCRIDLSTSDPGLPDIEALLDQGFCGVRMALSPGLGNERVLTATLEALDHKDRVLVVHAPDGIGLYVNQLTEWIERYPHLRLFVPHLGWPRTANAEPTPGWSDGIRTLSVYPRIYFGVSALYYNSQKSYPFQDVYPFVQTVLAAYGPGRCVLAGDYPMSLERCTYRQVWESLVKAIDNDAAFQIMWSVTPSQLWGER